MMLTFVQIAGGAPVPDEPAPVPPLAKCTVAFPGMAQYPLLDGNPEKPSDVQIAVGPGRDAKGRIVQVTNNGIQLMTKDGTLVAGPVPLERFSNAPADSCFDPRVLYDHYSSRFFVVMAGGKEARSSTLHISVSLTSAPDSLLAADWRTYATTASATFSGKATWIDYPAVGADPGRLVVTGNMTDENKMHRGGKIRVIDKRELLLGNCRFRDFDLPVGTAGGGTYTMQPAHAYDEAKDSAFWIVSRASAEQFRIWKVSGPSDDPALVDFPPQLWNAGRQDRQGAPQKGSSGIRLHTSSGKVMNALYRAGAVHCVQSSDVDGDGKTEVFFTRIRCEDARSTTPVLEESVVLGSASAGAWSYVPALAVTSTGDVGICYTTSSNDEYAAMFFGLLRGKVGAKGPAARLRLRDSVGEYDPIDRHNPEKWADYCSCVLDPEEERVFWAASEYCVTPRKDGDDAQWGTWISRVEIMPPK